MKILSKLSQTPHTVITPYSDPPAFTTRKHRQPKKPSQPSEWKICNSSCLSVTYSTGQFSSIGVGRSCHGEIIMSLIYLLTHPMKWSPSWEANWFWASQEIPRILWNLKVHYHICKYLPHVPVQIQMNPVHAPILLTEDPSQYYPPI